MMTPHLAPITEEFIAQVAEFKKEWYEFYQSISNEPTPRVDGTGKIIVDRRPDGYDYIEETHIRNMLDKHFPGWSWEMAAPLQFLGAEWIVAQGHLSIVDVHLIPLQVEPPIRKFYGVDSVRIQYRLMSDPTDPKKKVPAPHTPDNIVDVGDNCKQASTAALKYAANRMCRIGDDIYDKRTEYKGAGSYETAFDTNPSADTFGKWVTAHKGIWTEIFKIIGTDDLSTIKDWRDVKAKVKSAKRW